MVTQMFSQKVRLDTLLAELSSAMLDSQGEYVLDLVTLEVIETTNDMRYAADRVIQDETGLDFLPEWAQESPSLLFLENREPERFLHIPKIAFAEMKSLMHQFAERVEEHKVSQALHESLEQKNPLKSFREELSYHTGFRTRWLDFKQAYGRKAAQKWLRKQNIKSA
ncbi:MAG: UPF0158 family protein [Bacteroidia bacterium]|nr:UPF0158 family protein [Bacteroidia bacterium]